MNALQVFSYNGSNVTFSNENGMWVNATDMAKKFEKQPYDWLRLQYAKDFLKALIEIRGFNTADLTFNTADSTVLNSIGLGNFVKIENGKYGGTWFHEDVAIEFARWLSPAFAIWCNDRIKEMFTGTMAKYPMTSDEAIAYGYGKALEKISRQSNVIKKQGKRITALLAQIKSDKEAKKERLLIEKTRSHEDLANWLSTAGFSGRVSLNEIYTRYKDHCINNGMRYPVCSILGKMLVSLEQERVRIQGRSYYLFSL